MVAQSKAYRDWVLGNKPLKLVAQVKNCAVPEFDTAPISNRGAEDIELLGRNPIIHTAWSRILSPAIEHITTICFLDV